MKYFTHRLSAKIFAIAVLLLCGIAAFATSRTSTGSGNWATAGTWSPASVPGSGDDVIIRSGDVITISSGLRACHNLTIGNSVTGANASLQITSGTLTVNGDLTLNPNSYAQSYTLDAGAGTVNIYGSVYGATSGTNSIQVSTGNIGFGSDVSPSDDGYTIVCRDAGIINFYGNFSDANNSITTYAGCEVHFNGDVTVSTTAVDWTSKGTVFFDADGTITASANVTFNNVELTSGEVTVNKDEGAVTINGTITLDDGSSFICNNDITVKGDWTNNGGSFSSTQGVTFAGTSALQIGGTAGTNFNKLTINNSGGVTLGAPASVRDLLTLTNGVLTTDATNILQLTATASSTSGSATSYVDGTMVKVGNTDFTFPLGNGGRWRRVGVSGMTDPNTTVTALYIYGTPPDITNMSSDLTDVSDQEYWDVSRTVTSDPIKIRLYWESTPLASLTEDCTPLTVAHYKGGKWQMESSTMQSDPSSCLLGSSGSIETDYVSSFSPFGFGGKGGGSLPIKLVSFDAVAKNNIVETNWTTEIEINNNYFTVERSADGQNFSEVGKVQGAGNSTALLNYDLNDEHPLSGISYYRLKQTDFDGHFSYSNIVPVTIKNIAPISFTVYPNPTDNELFVNVQNPSDEIKVEIIDMLGRKVFAKIFSAEEKSIRHTISLQAKYLLSPGIYMLSVSTNGTEHSERIVLN